jgi:CheY-like chemotaxis protein
MTSHKILWVDDEIDILAAHIAFLEQKGFAVTPCRSGDDAVVLVGKNDYDIILLDEMMPGKNGLETLVELKELRPHIPVVMVTKSEEETLMEDAIGQKIDDYLTKPVNPSQVLMAVKRHVQSKKIVTGRLGQRYIADINRMNMTLSGPVTWTDWIDAFRMLCDWDLELDDYPDDGLYQTHLGTHKEWNSQFCRYYEKHYENWVNSNNHPPMSVDLVDQTVIPRLKKGEQVVFIVIDCMRMDLWMRIEPLLADLYHIPSYRRRRRSPVMPFSAGNSRSMLHGHIPMTGKRIPMMKFPATVARGSFLKNSWSAKKCPFRAAPSISKCSMPRKARGWPRRWRIIFRRS